MGLKTLSNVKPLEKKPLLEIDITEYVGEKSSLFFREPRASEIFPDMDATRDLGIKFPEMPSAMIYQIQLLGKCYEPDAEDANSIINPSHTFGNIARGHKDLFFHILGSFLEAFQGTDIEDKISEVPNASME